MITAILGCQSTATGDGVGGAAGGSRGGGSGGAGAGLGGSSGASGVGGAPTAGAGGHATDAGPSDAAGGGGARDGGNDGPPPGRSDSGGVEAGGLDGLPVAQVLDGLALLKPCFSQPATCAGCTCDENPTNTLSSGAAPENQHITKQFGGDPNVTYNVKLRVVGVAERYWYTGGMLDPLSRVFYTGGLPTIHMPPQAPNSNLSSGQGACKIHPPQTDNAPSSFPIPFAVPPEVAPADNCYNGFNIFAMTISSPKKSYYLNYTTAFDGIDRQPHAVYSTDYTVTIPIVGQAQIDFYVIDGDHHEVANTNMTVPNLKNTTIKQPYIGNFLELEVVDVTRAN